MQRDSTAQSVSFPCLIFGNSAAFSVEVSDIGRRFPVCLRVHYHCIKDRARFGSCLGDAEQEKAVEKVLELTSQGWKRSEIATELSLSYSTVKRYQSPDFSPVHGLYNTTKNSKIKPYEEKIKYMLKENCTFKQIEEAIKEDSYDGGFFNDTDVYYP